MNANVQVLCSACDKCKKFEVEQETLWTYDEPYVYLLYCKNIDICQNAVDIWEKQNESNTCNQNAL